VLAALLLAGLVVAPVSSAALFVPAQRGGRTRGAWPAVRRLILALAGTAVFAAGIAGLLSVLNFSTTVVIATAVAFTAASLAWLPATRRWNARGHLCWVSSVFLFVAYLAFILQWTFAGNLGWASTIGGLLLWTFELLAAILAGAYLWELCDALGTEQWRRRVTTPKPVPATAPDNDLPFVCLQVPAHNEPPDMVIQTPRTRACGGRSPTGAPGTV